MSIQRPKPERPKAVKPGEAMLLAPDRGDLVWMDFGSPSGHEQGGRRPGLVISPRAYNAKVGLALMCPITSRSKGYPFEVPLPSGMGVQGVVLSDHLKSLDWRARKARFADHVPEDVIAEVLAKAAVLLTPEA